MTFSVLWTTVPNGTEPANGGRVRLCLVASPRIETPDTTLGGSDLADWPARIRTLGPLALRVHGQQALLPATVISAAPSTALWQSLLPGTTKVARPFNGVRRLRTTPNETYVQAADAISTIFRSPGGGPITEVASRGPSAGQSLATRALAALGVLAARGAAGDARVLAAAPASARGGGPIRLAALGGAALASTVDTLRQQGHDDLAVALPIAAHVAALRGSDGAVGDPVNQAVGPPAPLSGINPIGAADVHQIIGLLLDHPVLAVAVGLRVDVTVPIPAAGLDGIQLVRLVRGDGTPLGDPPTPVPAGGSGMVARPQPWSQVQLTRGTGLFTMADAGEVRGGLLDLSDPDPSRPYLVTGDDVTGLSAHLATVSTPPGQQARLPVRRDAGLTLAQRNRPTGVVEKAMDNAVFLVGGAGAVDGAPVLTAADVTTGYRIDASRDGAAFRSLVKRRVRYRVGTGAAAVIVQAPTPAVAGSDEGKVQRAVAVQQLDPDGTHRLRVGEEIGQWNGWSMAAPPPGRTVTAEPGGTSTTEPIGAEPIPGVPLTAEVTAEPGSLPRLRFGSRYRLRGRAVYLGGVSIDAASADQSQLTAPHHYLRTEAVSSPTLVHRTRNTEGESLTRMVVRSTGDGTTIGGPSERHVAPPKTSVQQAEWHGAFDAAFGPDSPERAAARATLLAVARREAGSFLDPGPGVSLVTNNPDRTPPVSLPVRRGDALPNGAYVVHDTPNPPLPYLADVAAGGVAFAGITSAAPVALPYQGGWPDVAPGRIVLRAGSGVTPTTTVKQENGRPVLLVDLPPGTERLVQLSSTIRPERLAEFDLGADGDAALPAPAIDPRLTPAVELTLVHAVQKPVTAPVFVGLPAHAAVANKTGVPIAAQLNCHRDSTARLDLVGTWTESVDTGRGPVLARIHTAVAGTVDVHRGIGPVTLAAVHQFGDTAARSVAYHAVASTRFAEYFPGRAAGPDGQRAGASATVAVPNRAVPPEPDVNAVIPTFSSTRTVSSGVITCDRFGTGVRVLLNRRWNVTGDGEQLGVVVFPDTATGNAALAARDGRLDLVSRWGSDPLEETTALAPAHLTPGRFARRNPLTTKAISLLDQRAGGKSLTVAGHAVEFDADRELWLSDIDILIPETQWPFIRLALVRYQPSSLPGKLISTVVKTDFCQLPPSRKAVFRRIGQFGVKVVISGAATRNSTFSLRHERRVHAPASAGIDIFSDAGVATGGADGWVLRDQTAAEDGVNVLSALVLDWNRPTPPPAAVVADLRNGRVVVEERQNGLAVAGPGADSRVIYTETVDRSALGIG